MHISVTTRNCCLMIHGDGCGKKLLPQEHRKRGKSDLIAETQKTNGREGKLLCRFPVAGRRNRAKFFVLEDFYGFYQAGMLYW